MKKIVAIILLSFTFLFGYNQGSYFPPITGNTWETMSPDELNWCQPQIDSLYDFLESKNTKAFIVLKDGKIVLEQYFGTHSQTTPWYWASAGKTLTAFMVGIAQQENYLSISDLTSQYLGQGWTDCTPQQEGAISIWNQLTMTSGLDDGVDNPTCLLDTCLQYIADAGTRWSYHNAPYTLLDSVIYYSTGSDLNGFIASRLTNTTGITGSFIPIDYNNVFFSTARSMARYGLLVLNNGNWAGTSVLADSTYLYNMTHTSQSLNEAYGYLWWLNGSNSYMIPQSQLQFPGMILPNAPSDMFCGLGKDGQFLNVVPSQNLVLIRMGESPDNSLVPYLMNDEIWEYMNNLTCNLVNITERNTNGFDLMLIPNPTTGHVRLESLKIVKYVEVINLNGQIIAAIDESKSIDCSAFKDGVYYVKVVFEDETEVIKKLVVGI